MTIDLTQICVALISVVGTILAAVITKYLIPWIKSKFKENQLAIISTWANVFVKAAEALKLDDVIENKLEYAVTQLSAKCTELGLIVDADTIRAAIESAWTGLTAAGIINIKEDKNNG